MNNTWLYISEEIPHKKTISCTKVTEFKNVGKFLCKLKSNRENQVHKKMQGLQEMKGGGIYCTQTYCGEQSTQTITEALKANKEHKIRLIH